MNCSLPHFVQSMGSLLPGAGTISTLTRKIKTCITLESSCVITKRIREQYWCEQKSELEGYPHYLPIIHSVSLCFALTPIHFSKPWPSLLSLFLRCYQTSLPLGKVYQLLWTPATVLNITFGNFEIKTVNCNYPLHRKDKCRHDKDVMMLVY